jgi:hypothetical protein
MFNVQSRIVRSVVIIATALGFGAGCGGTIDEMEPVQEEAFATQEAAAEEPRKLEDLAAFLERDAGILHTVDTEQAMALRQLEAVKINDSQYQSKDTLTGEVSIFRVQPYSIKAWLPLLKICPNGQIVPYWVTCPTIIAQDPLTRVWKNSSCGWKIQNAGWSACTNTSSGSSYRYQYYEAWKCGVGSGYCVERRAVKTVRYNYDLAMCDPAIITGVTPTAYDFLCKH